MKVICAHCGEAIEDNGSIYEGKTYHEVCFTSFKIEEDEGRVYTLSQTFPRIDYNILEELFEPYAHNATGLGMLTEKMNANWCVIIDTVGTDLNRFNTKKDMLNYLTREIEIALMEGYCFEVLYILNKGKLIKSVNGFEIKVKLI